MESFDSSPMLPRQPLHRSDAPPMWGSACGGTRPGEVPSPWSDCKHLPRAAPPLADRCAIEVRLVEAGLSPPAARTALTHLASWLASREGRTQIASAEAAARMRGETPFHIGDRVRFREVGVSLGSAEQQGTIWSYAVDGGRWKVLPSRGGEAVWLHAVNLELLEERPGAAHAFLPCSVSQPPPVGNTGNLVGPSGRPGEGGVGVAAAGTAPVARPPSNSPELRCPCWNMCGANEEKEDVHVDEVWDMDWTNLRRAAAANQDDRKHGAASVPGHPAAVPYTPGGAAGGGRGGGAAAMNNPGSANGSPWLRRDAAAAASSPSPEPSAPRAREPPRWCQQGEPNLVSAVAGELQCELRLLAQSAIDPPLPAAPVDLGAPPRSVAASPAREPSLGRSGVGAAAAAARSPWPPPYQEPPRQEVPQRSPPPQPQSPPQPQPASAPKPFEPGAEPRCSPRSQWFASEARALRWENAALRRNLGIEERTERPPPSMPHSQPPHPHAPTPSPSPPRVGAGAAGTYASTGPASMATPTPPEPLSRAVPRLSMPPPSTHEPPHVATPSREPATPCRHSPPELQQAREAAPLHVTTARLAASKAVAAMQKTRPGVGSMWPWSRGAAGRPDVADHSGRPAPQQPPAPPRRETPLPAESLRPGSAAAAKIRVDIKSRAGFGPPTRPCEAPPWRPPSAPRAAACSTPSAGGACRDAWGTSAPAPAVRPGSGHSASRVYGGLPFCRGAAVRVKPI